MSELAESLKKCRIEGNTLYLPKEMLSNYADVKRALMNAGGKYKKNTFVFSSDAQPFIDRLTEGKSVNVRKEFQEFYTPSELADHAVKLAEIKKHHSILEPSAGQGAMVNAIHRAVPGSVVDCCELMPENQVILSRIVNSTFICDDFLKIGEEWNGHFDRVIANPPFTKNSDVLHIRKMYECLKPGGRLVSIASKHWQFASGKKEEDFRQWLMDVKSKTYDIEAGKFKESGTMVASCIIVINKKS